MRCCSAGGRWRPAAALRIDDPLEGQALGRRRASVQDPIAGLQQRVDRLGVEPSPARLDQQRHDAAHHPAQEGVRRDPDLDRGAALHDANLRHAPDRPTAGVAAERSEVTLPKERGRGGAHGTHVQPVVDLERPMPIGHAPLACHPDPVAVHARDRVAPRVESGGRRAERAHRQVRRQDGVQPLLQLRPADPPVAGATRQAEGRDLAGGMHPGIGSPGESDASPLAGQSVKRPLQLPLHRPSVRLVLGAGEGGPVVLDHRSRASLRVGRHRVRLRLSRPVRARLGQTSSIWTIGAASPSLSPIRVMRVKPELRSAYLVASSPISLSTMSGSCGIWEASERRA